jgi:hypothetical protein
MMHIHQVVIGHHPTVTIIQIVIDLTLGDLSTLIRTIAVRSPQIDTISHASLQLLTVGTVVLPGHHIVRLA